MFNSISPKLLALKLQNPKQLRKTPNIVLNRRAAASHQHPAAVDSKPSKPLSHHTSHRNAHYTKPGESCPKILRRGLQRAPGTVVGNLDTALTYHAIVDMERVVAVMGTAEASSVIVVAVARVVYSSCRCVVRVP